MSDTIHILVVPGEEKLDAAITREIEKNGFRIETSREVSDVRACMRDSSCSVALVDLRWRGANGLDLIKKLCGFPDAPEVVVLAGAQDADVAVEAVKLGAVNYVIAPFDPDEISLVIRNAHSHWDMKRRSRLMRLELAGRGEATWIVGESLVVRQLINIVSRIGPTESTTLIRGEHGSGRELVARAIHKKSTRKHEPFIVVDCGAIHPNALEGLLFGREPDPANETAGIEYGLLEVADNGTMFIDEISEIGPQTQKSLVRLLETGQFRRLGGRKNIRVNLRLIAATTKDLSPMVEAGKFREDLFYRLNTITIYVPPLRERKEDLPLLCRHFIENSMHHAGVTNIPDKVMEKLMAYNWPGNVGELKDALRLALIVSDGPELKADDFPLPFRSGEAKQSSLQNQLSSPARLKELEKEYIRKTLQDTGGNRRRAAKILGISERSLYRKIKELDEIIL